MNITRDCRRCGEPFTIKASHQMWCSALCRMGREKETLPLKLCATCGTEYKPKSMRQVFCSPACRPELPKPLGLATATVGAISELAVCTDLMLKGFHVYRALSAACPVDLIAWRGTTFLKVEVKTGWFTYAGKLMAPTHASNDHDVLAIYFRQGPRIVYRTTDGKDIEIT